MSKPIIEVIKSTVGNRYSLKVDGIHVGNYIYGKDEIYKYPIRWAKKMVPLRLKTCDRNIDRLESELAMWLRERDILKEVDLGD